jgi:Domain of unknown function (DUF4331)
VRGGGHRYATGSQARQPEPAGDVLISDAPVGFDAAAQPVQAGPCLRFTGVRSDPFFADADGAFHGLKWTGQDAFANRNILSVALAVPTEMLGRDPVIGVWATVSVRRDGVLMQVDRGGHPMINPFVNPDDVKDQYNVRLNLAAGDREPARWHFRLDGADYLIESDGRQWTLSAGAPPAAADVAITAASRDLPALIFAGSDADIDITGEAGAVQRFRRLIGTMATVVQPR